MLLAEAATNVIQIEWQALVAASSAIGLAIGTAIVTAAKILTAQWKENVAFEAQRHKEAREDSLEARKENRGLSQMILDNQARAVETQARSVENQARMADAMLGMQREIERILNHLQMDSRGSKPHAALPH